MKAQSIQQTGADRLTAALATIYLLVLGWILILKLGVRFSYMGARRLNLIPFNEPSFFDRENILNIIIFIPVGIYAAALFEKWRFGQNLLLFFTLSLGVETLQYLARIGAFDITDLINNTAGGISGWTLYKAMGRLFKNKLQAQKSFNLLAAAATILMVLLLALLKLNMLPIRYQ